MTANTLSAGTEANTWEELKNHLHIMKFWNSGFHDVDSGLQALDCWIPSQRNLDSKALDSTFTRTTARIYSVFPRMEREGVKGNLFGKEIRQPAKAWYALRGIYSESGLRSERKQLYYKILTIKNVVEELNGQTTKTVVILLRTVRIHHSPVRTRTEKAPVKSLLSKS